MAKPSARTGEITTFCKVTPLHRRRLDPYNSVYLGVGEEYIVDANYAKFLVDMDEAEILEEGVTPPWEAPPPPPPPAADTAAKSEHKHPLASHHNKDK
jgi:hypothetical protein